MGQEVSNLMANTKEKGDELFESGNYFEALVYYNIELAFAQKDKQPELAGNAYVSRSAVYLKLKMYKECLQNIDWARQNYFAMEDLEKLMEYEEMCKRFMEADNKEAPESFFKLSYSANPKIPFIVENLYMKETPEFGRGIYTATDLKPGDVIAIEQPAFSVFYDQDPLNYKHCLNCFKSSMMNLIPCAPQLQTAFAMFCSEDCRDEFHKHNMSRHELWDFFTREFWEVSIGVILTFFGKFVKGELDAFIDSFDSKNYTKTVFDFDFSGDPKDEDYKANLLHCFLALPNEKANTKALNPSPFAYHVKRDKELQLIKHFHAIFGCNRSDIEFQAQTKLSNEKHGFAILPFGALIKKSSDPNVSAVAVDNKFAFVVQKPIKAHEQLFVTFESDSALKICQCEWFSEVKHRPAPKSYAAAVEELKSNWNLIETGDCSCGNVNHELIARNVKLLNFLAKCETFPQNII